MSPKDAGPESEDRIDPKDLRDPTEVEELEAEVDKLIAADTKGEDLPAPADGDSDEESESGSSGSEKPGSKEPAQGQSTEQLLRELAEARQTLLETNRALQQVLEAENNQDDEAEAEVPYDIGDLPEGFGDLKEVLNRLGQSSTQRAERIEKHLETIARTQQEKLNQLESTLVKTTLKVSKDEEEKVIAWANQKRRGFSNVEELVELIGDYRDHVELESYREKKTVGLRPAPEKLANQKSRQSSKGATEQADEEKMDPFDRAFNKALRQNIGSLRRGAA